MKRTGYPVLGIVVAGMGMAHVNAAPAAEKMNVLFFAIDDLNDWVGCMGGQSAGEDSEPGSI